MVTYKTGVYIMNCPECGKKMEYQFCPFVTSIEAGLGEIPEIKKTPATHYRCNECDTEWTKIGRGKPRMIDGAQKPIHCGLKLMRDNS